jgi:hypothetical protein
MFLKTVWKLGEMREGWRTYPDGPVGEGGVQHVKVTEDETLSP